MWRLIQQMFADFPAKIEAKEIIGSYCPGSYDLSIGGKKFAGISQRRLRKGVAVQIYLCVSGIGAGRAELIREFYKRAKGGQYTKFSYPEIIPEVMASLSELLNTPLTIADCMMRLLTELKKNSSRFYAGQLNEYELELLPSYVQRITERNEKFAEL